MNKHLLAMICLLLPAFSGGIQAQELRKNLNLADEAFEAGEFYRADSLYSESIEKGANPALAEFNRGDALYRKGDFEEASDAFEASANRTNNPLEKAEALFNKGNAHYQASQWKEAAEAFKQSLRLNPADSDARHNLMLAKKKLNQQNQDQQNQDQQNQDQQNQDQQNQDQQNQDQQNQDQQNQDQQNQDQQNQDQQNQDQQNQNQQNQGDSSDEPNSKSKNQQAMPNKISKEEAERMLKALDQREKLLQQALRRKDKEGEKRKVEKDW